MFNELFPSFLCQIERILCAFNLFVRLTWLRDYVIVFSLLYLNSALFIYAVTILEINLKNSSTISYLCESCKGNTRDNLRHKTKKKSFSSNIYIKKFKIFRANDDQFRARRCIVCSEGLERILEGQAVV